MFFVTLDYLLFLGSIVIQAMIPSFKESYLLLGTSTALSISYLTHTLTIELLLLTMIGFFYNAYHTVENNVCYRENAYVNTVILLTIWSCIKHRVPPHINRITKWCIYGSICSCLPSSYEHQLYILFKSISMAYWIASMLHYKKWNMNYTYSLIFWNMICLYLCVYDYSVEQVFILSTWIPLLL